MYVIRLLWHLISKTLVSKILFPIILLAQYLSILTDEYFPCRKMVVFTCECCRYTARTGLAFQQHCVNAHFRCIKCQKSFYHKTGIMHHLANAHREKVKCDHCDYMEYPPTNVIRHELLTHKTCSECGKLHGSVADLQKHMSDMHGMDKPSDSEKITPKETKQIVETAPQSEISTKIPDDVKIKEEIIDEDNSELAEKPKEDFGALVTLEDGESLLLKNKQQQKQLQQQQQLQRKQHLQQQQILKQLQRQRLQQLQQQNLQQLQQKEEASDDRQTCDLCDMILLDKDDLQKHIAERRNVLYTCDCCVWRACTLDGLIIHKNANHPRPKKIVVTIEPPEKKFKRDGSPRDPLADSSDDENPNYDPGTIVESTADGHQILKRRCLKCNFTAKYPYDIYLHGINVHKRCTKCNEDFGTKKGIMDHLSTVHCERVQCDMCDFQGFPAFQLSIHQTLTHKVSLIFNKSKNI